MTQEIPSVTPPPNESVQKQLAELDHLYRTAPVGLCSLDRELRFLRINERLAEIDGKPVSAHIGRTIRDVIPEMASTMEPILRQIIESGKPVLNLEVSGTTPAQPGMERFWLSNYYPLTAADGQVQSISVVVQEITERKRAEQALLESERRYRELVENSQGIICTHDLDGTLLSVNPAAARSLGYEPRDVVGMNLADILAPNVRHLLRDYLERVRRERAATGLMRAMSKEGEQLIWTYRNVLQEEEGRAPYVIGHALDITEQTRAEHALRETLDQLEKRVEDRTRELSEANASLRAEVAQREKAQHALRSREKGFRRLLETTNVIPWEADANTWQFTYIGPQVANLLGYSIDQWYEKNFWSTHIHPDDRDDAIEFCLKSSRTCKDYEFEYRMIASNGSAVWLHDVVSIVSVKGEPERLQGFLFDITARKQAEEEVAQLRERLAQVMQANSVGVRSEK